MQIELQKVKMIKPTVARSKLLQEVRNFFYNNNYIEVETPIIIKAPCMEDHINAIKCGDFFLRTSPELFHKRLLSKNINRLFEIGKCFRDGEIGKLHNPEYTMLEWYTVNCNYIDTLEFTKKLINHIANFFNKSIPGVRIYTVKDIFKKLFNWDPINNYDEVRFCDYISGPFESYLKEKGGMVFLKDYPHQQAALSKISDHNKKISERWELYIDGIEIANAYTELTCSVEQKKRFLDCAKKRRKLNQEVYPIDHDFIDILDNVPECSGCALGIDRLLLWLINEDNLDAILDRDPFIY